MTPLKFPAKLPALLKTLVLALGLTGLIAWPMAVVAQEQPAPGPETVVATVGGEPITEADLAYIAEDIGAELNNIPPDQIRAVLLAQAIDLKLMAQAGTTAGLENDPLYKTRLEYLTDRALRRAFTQTAISDTITPEEIQAEYDKQVAAIPNEDEVHARHILVTTEDDAKAIKAELDAGADFVTLAKEKSIEPNAAQSGGDLGYFKAAMMVKPFADAAFAMEVGQVSEPIQTQFGWHIIKLEDRRPAAKPTLEQLTPQIGQQLYVTKYRAKFDELRKATPIEIPDQALADGVNTQLGPLQ
ncbi:MAG: peptidylprolyl isomerase [Hyphomicrobiales bacterium]|nr:MAG: peptidylprolyl isomerase [Hyphomicrobiales bacterium]